MRKIILQDRFLGGGGDDVEPVYPSINVLRSKVASPVSGLGTNQAATALVVNNGGGERARSYSFWFKADNISHVDQLIWSIGSGGTDQIMMEYYGDTRTDDHWQKLRFTLAGNAGRTQTLDILSSVRCLRNRWYNVVVTYNGGAASTSLKIYINGTLDSGASVTDTSYTTGFVDANNFLRVFRSSTVTTTYGGELSDLSFWDKELSAAEVTEMYNSGELKRASTLSYVANLIETFPFSTNFDGTIIPITSVEVDTAGVLAIQSSFVNATAEPISFVKTVSNNANYDAFGKLINNGDEYVWYGGYNANDHIGTSNARIVAKVPYVKSLGLLQTYTPVIAISDGSYNVQGGTTAIINGKVVNFSSRYQGSTDTFIDTGRYESTDGLTGETFGAIATMATTYSRYEFYGRVVSGFAAGEYFVPFFEHNGSGTYRISVFRTTDNGATYSKITVHESTNQLGEAALINLGSNRLLVLARKVNSTFGLWQIVSTDGGLTWGSPVETNLGGTGAGQNADMCLKNGKITVVFMDRSGRGLWISKENSIPTILSDPTAWATPFKIWESYTSDSYGILGYPSIIYDGNSKYIIAVSGEFSAARCDLFFGYGNFVANGTD